MERIQLLVDTAQILVAILANRETGDYVLLPMGAYPVSKELLVQLLFGWRLRYHGVAGLMPDGSPCSAFSSELEPLSDEGLAGIAELVSKYCVEVLAGPSPKPTDDFVEFAVRLFRLPDARPS